MAGCDDEINGEGSARPWEWIGADALRRLLASGEDPDGKDWFGKTWAARSAMEGDLEALEMLALAGADLDAADDEGFSPMCLAIEKRQTKAVQALLAIGASPDGAPSGRSPLTLAAMKGLPEIVEALLAAGADPNRSMDGGAPPILLATMALDARSVRALAGAGADVGARIDAGEGLLGYDGIGLVVRALGAGNPAIDAGTETIKALIEAGGDPNSRWGVGEWLSLNVCCGRPELGPVISALVEAGADPRLRDGSGSNARQAAAAAGTLDILEAALSEIERSAIYEAAGSSAETAKMRL